MKKLKIISILALTTLYLSCQNVTEDKNSQKDNASGQENAAIPSLSFDLDRHKDKFKFGHLDSFSMDSITWNKRANHYRKLTESEYFSVYQDTSKEYYGEHELSIDLDFFYSIQNRNSDFQEITVLWQKEGDYCDGIEYLIFSKDGKLIDDFPVAGSCGDGGYFDDKYGHFLNDSTYKLIVEDNYETDDNEEAMIITKTEKIFTITRQGKVKMTEKIISTDTIN